MSGKTEKVLKDHPEVTGSAEDYFFYEKEPVIEEVVNRGDVRSKEPKAYDITDKDMEDLAKHSLKCIDKDLLEDNRIAAINSAVSMAVGTMDSGRWQGKVNSSTSNILTAMVDKLLNKTAENKIMDGTNQNELTTNKNGTSVEEIDKAKTAKTASAKEAPSKGVVVKLKGGRPQTQSQGQTNKSLSKMPARDRAGIKKMIQQGDTVVLSSVSNRLDKVAALLEGAGMTSLAMQLDAVANTLEKEAGALEELAQHRKDTNSQGLRYFDQGDVENHNPVNGTDLKRKVGWLYEALESFNSKSPNWNPTPLATKILKDFLHNPAYAETLKSTMGREEYNKAVNLAMTIIKTSSEYAELMVILDKYKDAPLVPTSNLEG